jgi:hypothetical protein
MHLLTYLLLLALVSLEETLTLSGYSNIPGVMLGGLARRQDLHSESRGRGNFAPWGLIDWIHGTSIGGDVMKDETEKHQVTERSSKAGKNAKESRKAGIRAWNSRRKSAKKS